MATRKLHVGIDLGTTNSTAALFDGEAVTPVRNGSGAVLTPSVVRIDARGNVTVGERARRSLDTDPANTRAEFKRLMGSQQRLDFKASGQSRRPEDLAAEVLRALRRDVADQTGVLVERAVVSVPALFELPQIAATAEAAHLAGFERIEVVQEPVASALAAGWTSEHGDHCWLVYDLGGGTFDVSLLETRDGLLRVVGHDGDNFLGGRDFDGLLVDHVLASLEAEGSVVDPANPAHATGLRRLRHAVEEAKIELSRTPEACISLAGAFVVDGRSIDVEAWIDQPTFHGLAVPLVDRSVAVCRRLLAAHGLAPGDLARIVLVGGPTIMPVLRERVSAGLGAPFIEGLDPMLLVATGAALHAGAVGLDAGAADAQEAFASDPTAWLQYPVVSSDPSPFVVGRLVEGDPITAVQLIRKDGDWKSPVVPLDAERAFAVAVALVPRAANEFRLVGVRPDATRCDVRPGTLRITHGVTIGDPPLSRSIGIALADNTVRVFFERGSPLPMRRTFTLATVASVHAHDEEAVLTVPIVQGEYGFAHLCRVVGTISIGGKAIRGTLAAGSEVEVTLELDRGGRLTGRALIPALGQTFEQVALLVVPNMDVEAVAAALAALQQRLGALQAQAFRDGDGALVGSLSEAASGISVTEHDVRLARGGDQDSVEKARRRLLEVDALLADAESAGVWPELERRAREELSVAVHWIGQYGNDTERRIFEEQAARVEQLLAARKAGELHRKVAQVEALSTTCYFRWPESWGREFDFAASRATEASDAVAAAAFVKAGREAVRRNDAAGIEAAVRGLQRLLPPKPEDRRLGHDSGVR